jgi:DNA-directed RNA polymerase I, II, and III subunit RPABC2
MADDDSGNFDIGPADDVGLDDLGDGDIAEDLGEEEETVEGGDGEIEVGEEKSDEEADTSTSEDEDGEAEIEAEGFAITEPEQLPEAEAPKVSNLFRTRRRLTKYERASIIGLRAQQIAEQAPRYTKPGLLTDPISIALKELSEGVIPFLINRPIPSFRAGKFTHDQCALSDLVDYNYPI